MTIKQQINDICNNLITEHEISLKSNPSKSNASFDNRFIKIMCCKDILDYCYSIEDIQTFINYYTLKKNKKGVHGFYVSLKVCEEILNKLHVNIPKS